MEWLVLIAIGIGFFLISLLKKRIPPVDSERNAEWWQRMESAVHSRSLIDIDIERFGSICVELLERLGLEIVSRESLSPCEILVLARYRHAIIGGDYLVLIVSGSRDGGPVDPARITELKRMVREEDALKGIVLTNTYFSDEAASTLDGKSIGMIDGIELGRLLETSD